MIGDSGEEWEEVSYDSVWGYSTLPLYIPIHIDGIIIVLLFTEGVPIQLKEDASEVVSLQYQFVVLYPGNQPRVAGVRNNYCNPLDN